MNQALSLYQRSVIIGLLLSDGSLVTNQEGGAYFKLAQTFNPNNVYILGHELLFFGFSLFQEFTHALVPSTGWARTGGGFSPRGAEAYYSLI